MLQKYTVEREATDRDGIGGEYVDQRGLSKTALENEAGLEIEKGRAKDTGPSRGPSSLRAIYRHPADEAQGLRPSWSLRDSTTPPGDDIASPERYPAIPS